MLEKCLKKHNENLLYVIYSDEIIPVDKELGNMLRDVIGDELIACGFDGDAPNEYGLMLEDLIDEVGRLFMQ